MTTESQPRRFEIRNSEKCYRFKPEAFTNHAPDHPGIYELVTFDENQNPQIIYVGGAFDTTIKACLEAHANGTLDPKADDIMARHPNLYFDFLAQIGGKTLEDAKDIHWWLIQKYKPVYNDVAAAKHSGRSDSIEVLELD